MIFHTAFCCLLIVSAVSCSLKHVGIYKPNDNSTKMPYLTLPLIQQMVIKYDFANFWGSSVMFAKMCDYEGEIYTIATCKLEPLLYAVLGEVSTTYMNVIYDNNITYVGRKSTNNLFKSDLDYICRSYGYAKRCIQSQKCESGLAHIVELLYEYICGSGKQDLLSIGQHLLDVDESVILSHIPQTDQCQTLYGDLSSTLQVMVSIFHVHVDQTLNPTAVKSYLKSLCNEWKYLNQCVLPAMNLGQQAVRFYQGFIMILKSDLKRRYEDSTSDVLSLIECDDDADHMQVTSTPTPHAKSMSGLHRYYHMMSQRFYKAYYHRSMRSESCSPIAVMDWMQFCFWNTASQVTNDVTSLTGLFSDIVNNAKVIRDGYLHPFLNCVTMNSSLDHTSGVKMDACHIRIDLDSASKQLYKILDISVVYPDCLADISAVVAESGDMVNTGCGLTLPGLLNLYVFQSAQIYMGVTDRPCEKRNNMGIFHGVSCLKTSLKSFFTNKTVSGNVGMDCLKEVIPVLDDFLMTLGDLMDQTYTFHSNLRKQGCCEKNHVPWDKCE